MVGISKVNRVGVAPDAVGVPHLCYQGGKKHLELLGNAPGVTWWAEWDCLALPVTRTNVLLIETIAQVEEATDDYVAVRNELLKAPSQKAFGYPEPAEGEPAPYQHQLDAFCFARETYDSLNDGFANLCHQGTGKSRMAIDLLRFYVFKKGLIVCQNSTTLQWQSHLQRSYPEATVMMLADKPLLQRKALLAEFSKQDWDGHPLIAVVNWEALARLLPALKKFRPEMIILDEVTRIKDRNTHMAKASHQLADLDSRRLVLTGTPIGDDPTDLWSIFRFVDSTLFGKSYWKFVEKYFRLGGFTGREFVGFRPENLSDFIEKMYRHAFRVTKATIGDMPERTYEVVQLEMSDDQMVAYRQMEKELYAKRLTEDGEERVLTGATALDQAIRLQQMTAGLFPANDAGETDYLLMESVKTKWLVNYLRDNLEDGDAQFIVWTRYRAERAAICAALATAGIAAGSYAYIDGTVPNEDREQLRKAFNDRSQPLRVLICQIQACSYGFDATGCDTLIYHSMTWSALERSQSEERGHRLGRKRPYTIIDLVCKDTIDEKIIAAIRRKQSLSDMLLMEGLASGASM